VHKKRYPKKQTMKRRKVRGGTKKSLAKIFFEMVEQTRRRDSEAAKHHAQSNAYEQASWKLEDLKEELKDVVKDDEKCDEILGLVHRYIGSEDSLFRELRSNQAYYDQGGLGQGEYWATNDHAEFVVWLRDEYGIDIDDIEAEPTPRDVSVEESPRKKKRSSSPTDAADQYEHVFGMNSNP